MSVILVTEVNEARTQIKHVEATGVLVGISFSRFTKASYRCCTIPFGFFQMSAVVYSMQSS